ncbi:MAG: AarF/ABC1/UbiB kinase family protein [Chloroflexia bacterium]|nr:AarF/ABC1/UbiB kinase family protein [Chloroflexia bacterium]
MAQVHEAYLHNGQKVAVKVQYTDIERMARLDLTSLKRILKIVEFFFNVKGITTNFGQIKEMILDELDFEKEAAHIETIAANFTNNPFIKFPKVVNEFSSHRVLTTHFMEGTKASSIPYLDNCKIDHEEVAQRIITAYCQMIFVDGIYHADPHPGNILVQQDGSVVFVDFGAVASLSPAMKEGIPQFLEGVLKRNKPQITESLQLMGFIAYTENGYDIEKLIGFIYGNFLKEMSFDSWSLSSIQENFQNPMDVLGDFRKLEISLRELMSLVQVPKDWILLERTIVLLMGLCTHLQSDMNPMNTIKPYLESFVLGKNKNWMKFIKEIIKDYATTVIKLPQELNQTLTKINKGEVNVNVKDIQESADLLYTLGHQVLYGLFCMVTGGLAYFSHYNDEPVLMKWLSGVSIFFAISLSVSMLKVRKRRRKRR